MNRRLLAVAAMILSLAAQTMSAQELATDAERSYRELRKSHDTKSQLLGERWYGAIKLQEWTDASGKFKTTAKYLEHDPELTWVKLRVIDGSGDQRVVKELTIPLEKLSKACQLRVRRISVLSDKVAAAVEAEKDIEKTGVGDDAGNDGHVGDMSDDRAVADGPPDRRGGRAAGLAGMDAEEAVADGRTRRPSPRAANHAPLPVLLPPLPGGPAHFALATSTPDAPAAVPAERH
jgi:hypothetical protein